MAFRLPQGCFPSPFRPSRTQSPILTPVRGNSTSRFDTDFLEEDSFTMDRKQGVLWKRRDVFKSQWRPRWFALLPGQGILTYYLLTTPVADTVTSASPSSLVSTPTRSVTTQTAPLTEPHPARRNRTTSWDSQVSENTLDYDVVPRGTIYLLGCKVTVNHNLSKPRENLFAFTISSPNPGDSLIHLAARTEESRKSWVEKIARVCRTEVGQDIGQMLPSTVSTVMEITNERIEEETDEEAEHQGPENTGTNGVMREAPLSWRGLGEPSQVFENVPSTLVTKIKDELPKHLDMCDEDSRGGGWRRMFEYANGDAAYQRYDASGRTMIKSVALLNHHPKQVFNLLVDISRRRDFETNVRADERLEVLNSHSFLDYYAYNAVWPTSAREFAVLTHWQVVGKGDERAIAMLSFSCPEAEALKPTFPNHVLASLHSSMYLLRAVGDGQCHLTRLLSFDLAGGISKHLSNVIISQQANLPAIISDFLRQHEPVPAYHLRGPLTDESVVTDVIDRLKNMARQTVRRHLTFNDPDALVVQDGNEVRSTVRLAPPLMTQAAVLLYPVILYQLALRLGISGTLPLFILMAWFAIRQLVLLHVGEVIPRVKVASLVDPVTCRFSVDLKGISRLVAARKQEREEAKSQSSGISVVHVVASAVARALKKEKTLLRRRICFPWLLIDGFVDLGARPVDVSISENTGRVVTVHDANEKSVQGIADEVVANEKMNLETTTDLGQCLILAAPDYDKSEMEMEARAIVPSVCVVATLGGVRLEREKKNPRNRSPAIAKPILTLSLTISSSGQPNIVACRRFAEDVRKFLQFPEMCDG